MQVKQGRRVIKLAQAVFECREGGKKAAISRSEPRQELGSRNQPRRRDLRRG